MIFSGTVLQEILRHGLISVLIASRLNQVVKPSAKIKTFKESSFHPCLQFQSFTNHLFQVVEYMRGAGISPKVPDIPDIPDDTLEEDFDKRFNM